jgi:hypothetical protein
VRSALRAGRTLTSRKITDTHTFGKSDSECKGLISFMYNTLYSASLNMFNTYSPFIISFAPLRYPEVYPGVESGGP